jgi:hypothetical protein
VGGVSQVFHMEHLKNQTGRWRRLQGIFALYRQHYQFLVNETGWPGMKPAWFAVISKVDYNIVR